MTIANRETAFKTKPEQLDIVLPDPALSWHGSDDDAYVVALRSDRLGDASFPESLGRQLMTTFMQTLLEGPDSPAAIILYGQAANLAHSDHQLSGSLLQLEKKGCDILCCRISYEALQPLSAPVVGHLTDWVDILTCFKRAMKVLWL